MQIHEHQEQLAEQGQPEVVELARPELSWAELRREVARRATLWDDPHITYHWDWAHTWEGWVRVVPYVYLWDGDQRWNSLVSSHPADSPYLLAWLADVARRQPDVDATDTRAVMRRVRSWLEGLL